VVRCPDAGQAGANDQHVDVLGHGGHTAEL
jgi:hypothetical protein